MPDPGCQIDATAGGEDSNSYAEVEDADAYHTLLRLPDSDWTTATPDTKCRALVWATRLLDEHIEWLGEIATETQALGWPRKGMVDQFGRALPDDELPQGLINATSELARYLIEADITAPLSSEGIKELKVASIEVEFSELRPPERKVIPDAVLQMISVWSKGKKFGTSSTVPLVRV